jgi:hypothetical protein
MCSAQMLRQLENMAADPRFRALQSRALQASAYVLMSAQEAQEYDARRMRIGELCECLGRFKPPSR